jgi:hypothetical protein
MMVSDQLVTGINELRGSFTELCSVPKWNFWARWVLYRSVRRATSVVEVEMSEVIARSVSGDDDASSCPVTSSLRRVFRDKQGDLWLDPGNGELLALDEPVCRRLREKWPQRVYEDIEQEFGRLVELVAPTPPQLAWVVQYRLVHQGRYGHWRTSAPGSREQAEEALSHFCVDSKTWETQLAYRTVGSAPGAWQVLK